MAAPPDFDAIIAKHGGESAEARAEYAAAVEAWRIERRRQIDEMNALDTEAIKASPTASRCHSPVETIKPQPALRRGSGAL
jgi:hypothetical protein